MLTALLSTVACSEVVEVLGPGVDTAVPRDGGTDESPGSDAGPSMPILSRFTEVSAGEWHTCATLGGRLYCWGDNREGELGLGHTDPQLSPSQVGAVDSWSLVRVGARATCVLATDGTIHCFGENGRGELGTGDFGLHPTLVESQLPVLAQSLALRHSHACAISTAGELWCWGHNREGQLGQADLFPGEDHAIPVQVGTAADWRAVDTGQGHTCGLRNPGTLWCWGRNTNGQLGLGPDAPEQIRVPEQVGTATDWTTVATGQSHTCARRSTGEVFCWGAPEPAGFAEPAPVQAPQALALADGSLFDDSSGALSSGAFSNCSVTRDAGLWCWGRGIEGQLGVDPTMEQFAPIEVPDGSRWQSVSVGRFHHCAVATDETVHCTGANAEGELGLGDTERRSRFTQLTFP